LRCAGRCHRTGDPASTVGVRHRLLRPDAPGACCTHASATPAGPCGFTLWRSWRDRLCADRAARFDRDAPPFDASLHSFRVARPRVMHRRLSAAGVPLPAGRESRGLVGPLSASKLALFPSRELGRQSSRPVVTRVTVSLSTPCARRRSWGFRVPFAGLIPRTGEVMLSTRSGPRAVCRIVRRSGLAARPAGPVEAGGRFASSPSIPVASDGAKWGGITRTAPDGVGRSRVNRCGFWVFRSRLRSTRVGVRLSRRA
jgi:hypothetical protein